MTIFKVQKYHIFYNNAKYTIIKNLKYNLLEQFLRSVIRGLLYSFQLKPVKIDYLKTLFLPMLRTPPGNLQGDYRFC